MKTFSEGIQIRANYLNGNPQEVNRIVRVNKDKYIILPWSEDCNWNSYKFWFNIEILVKNVESIVELIFNWDDTIFNNLRDEIYFKEEKSDEWECEAAESYTCDGKIKFKLYLKKRNLHRYKCSKI